jgi:aerobic-type carbon monoxide dehydrogenase small subunit (CoxS/CutS family)
MKREDHRPDDKQASGFSRRKFLKGAASSAAASTALATLPGIAEAAPAESAVRSGLTRYAVDGAEMVLKVNGAERKLTLTPQTTLLQALRENCELTGSKEVCDRGACGACTVHVDGKSVNSCMLLAVDAIGHEIRTIEGLKKGDQLDPVQQAFIDHDACQCGFCIPGMVMRSRALLDEKPNLDREGIKDGMCGNICRCAAYVRILDAVESVAKGGRS